ncbi:hypothetical protein CBS470a_013150 [Colletotrichum nupharicola]|nr:hypothetical protein CBS470a_013150 [Colletotrichum nupharicola]
MLFHRLIVVAAVAFGLASALTDLGPVKGLNRRQAKSTQCVVPTNGDGSDDTPVILAAFDKCKTDGHIVFENVSYHIGQVMKTTDLNNVKIDIKGTLLWSKNTTYWLENSLPIGYQNQTTAWVLGGKHLDVNGLAMAHSMVTAKLGMTWSRENRTILTGLMLFCLTEQKIPSSRVFARNTDGANTMFSDNIHFRRWTVKNGDDCIATKANSTNILIEDVEFHDGQGVAIGSIGQYAGQFETIENVTVRNVLAHGSRYAGRIKTWTGEQLGYPPNGGGAGLGCKS